MTKASGIACIGFLCAGLMLASAATGAGQAAAPAGQPAPTSPGAGPVIVVETVKGTFEFETYPNEAPKTVARIVELVNKRFYNGQRVHRVVPNFVMQLGDPTTRDMTKQADWGRMGRARRSAWPRSPRRARTCAARWSWRTRGMRPRLTVSGT